MKTTIFRLRKSGFPRGRDFPMNDISRGRDIFRTRFPVDEISRGRDIL